MKEKSFFSDLPKFVQKLFVSSQNIAKSSNFSNSKDRWRTQDQKS